MIYEPFTYLSNAGFHLILTRKVLIKTSSTYIHKKYYMIVDSTGLIN